MNSAAEDILACISWAYVVHISISTYLEEKCWVSEYAYVHVL